MPDPQSSDICHKRYTIAFPLASDHLLIPFLDHLLDGELCNSFFYYRIFSFFWLSITILSCTLILPVSQLQTQQLTTSQIRLHIEYLTQTYNILVLILYSKLIKKYSLVGGFQ